MIIQSIRMALKAIISNKMRSFLTMLGIIIGVFSLVVLVSLVNGATGYVTNSISALGGDYIEVSIAKDKGKPINSDDLTQLREIPDFRDVAGSALSPCTMVANKEDKTGNMYGITPGYLKIEKLKLEYGRYISSVDEENHVKVAIISSETAQRLFNRIDVVGQSINLNGINYDIVGVLATADGFIGMIMGMDNTAYVPFSCFTRQPEAKSVGFNSIVLSLKPGANLDEAKLTLTDYFNKRLDNDKDAYSITSQDQISDTLGSVTTILTIVFGGVAAISLLVGGIGIMNIMLVSVTERTREIGIRKSIGATTQSILLQFLIEAFVISLTGCIIGLIISYGFIELANVVVKAFQIDVHFTLPFSVVLGSAAFSLLVGLIFGLYPANKAAKKKPIDALRYDG